MASPTSGAVNSTETTEAKPKKERPCDACRKRKSRCVLYDGQKLCVLCEFHHQECTFLQTPQPRKRKLNGDAANGTDERHNRRWHSSSRSPEADPLPRKLSRPSVITPLSTHPSIRVDKPPVKDYAELRGPSLLKKTLGLQSHRHSRYIGATTEFEPSVLKLATFDRKEETTFSHNTIRRVNDRHMFLMQADDSTPDYQDEIEDLDTIESIVTPYGQELINLYFRIVHPSFPILHKRVYLEKYSRTYREFSPPLLAAVYILALNWWSYSSHLAHLPKPDVRMLERLALKAINNVIQRPKISTVQAGLLLLQRPDSDSWSLTAQLMVIGQGLGLHLDCSNWKIPIWEQGLRRRLAWGLYMQDKWSALIYGRPSQIHESNWAVRPVSEQDFPENATDEDEEEGSTEVRKGMILFTQMIALTRILSEILETFYSLRAMQEIEDEGRNGTQLILEKAKPLQISLRDWFTALPDSLRMDSTKVMKLSSTGYLHLAYYATEITLHRCIIRSLSAYVPSSLHHICRSAARARLISAIDFVYRLRPEHLQSFWYFASKINLAIIGSFGCLLWTTAGEKDEREFYRGKLSEYKWTLRVSSKGVEFMGFAMGVIDASVTLLSEQERGSKNGHSGDVVTAIGTDEVLKLQKAQQQQYPTSEESIGTMTEGYPASVENAISGFVDTIGEEYDGTDMDFQGLLDQAVADANDNVSPSATVSADLSEHDGAGSEASAGYYVNGVDVANSHEQFDFMPRPEMWMEMGNVVVNGWGSGE